MVQRAWGAISFPVVVLVIVTVISAALLGVGTLLTLVFAVSVFEATVVATTVTAAVYWVFYGLGPHYLVDGHLVTPIEDDEDMHAEITDVSFRPGRSRRRRRR